MRKIPLSRPSFGEEEVRAVQAVLESGWVAHGPKNHELEELMKNYFGVEEVILVNSGASALFLSLLGLGIKGEVIIPSFTMSATANAVLLAGATPVCAEVLWETGNLDPAKLEEKITVHTEAIIPVHFAGRPCDMDPILEIAKKHNLKVIEDSAETIGAKYKGNYAGAMGDAGCFSFWASKNITTGEGGAVLTNNKEVALSVRTLMAHGIATTTLEREKAIRPWVRNSVVPGYNMRLSDINAAIGIEQFKKLDRLNSLRKEKSAQLTKKLSEVPGIELPVPNSKEDHVYQMYVIRVDEAKRDQLVLDLREKGIGASVHFDPPAHTQSFFTERYGSVSLPVTEKLSRSVITLPMYPDVSDDDIDYIADTFISILKS